MEIWILAAVVACAVIGGRDLLIPLVFIGGILYLASGG